MTTPGASGVFSARQLTLIDRARAALRPDEQVIDVTIGEVAVTRLGVGTTREAIVLATDRRVIIYVGRRNGYDIWDHLYPLITVVEYSRGRWTGQLRLTSADKRSEVTRIAAEDGARFAQVVRERQAYAAVGSWPTPQAPPTVAAELRSLAELRDEGILTDDQFEAKKRQILGL